MELVEEVKQVELPMPCLTSKGHTWKQPTPLRCDPWRAAVSNLCGLTASLIGCAYKLSHLQGRLSRRQKGAEQQTGVHSPDQPKEENERTSGQG